jgi:seryl-tRNA synthetase
MNDANLLRKDPEAARRGFKSRNEKLLAQYEAWLKDDAEYRDLLKKVEDLRSKRNASSQAIGKAKASKNEAEAQKLMAEVAGLKDEMAKAEAALAPLAEKTKLGGLGLPHLPHESVPVGHDETQNVEVRRHGTPREFDFAPKDHVALGEEGLKIFSTADGARLSGSRFALWSGQGAKLIRAIINFQLDLHAKAGYVEVHPPLLVKPEILEGTGQLPKFEADLYKTKNADGDKATDLFLIPTAEVPVTNLVRDNILRPETPLPLKYTAYTPCFRQEAGSYGKDVRGLIRNHQFDKVELVWITRPEDSLAALEQLTKDAEAVLQALELPYRVIALCTGDMGFASRKTYDIEVWIPSEKKYREISSCSDCGDFQARRMEARFKRDAKGATEYLHTLNGSGVAVGRLFVAILENYQEKDGSVLIPKVLQPYCGFDRITNDRRFPVNLTDEIDI